MYLRLKETSNCVQGAASLVKLDTPMGTHTSAMADPTVPRWPFFVFLAGAMFCLLCSSFCHLLSCHSHRLNLFLIRLDFVGIAVMIVTSFFPPIYYIFQCDPQWQIVYLTAISAFGLVTIYTLLDPHLSNARYVWVNFSCWA
jgi:adiponectin receptor